MMSSRPENAAPRAPCASSDAVLTSKLEKALASLDDAMQEIGSEPRLLARASMTLPRADAVLFGSCSERDNFKVMGKVWKSVTVSLTKLSRMDKETLRGAWSATSPDGIAAFALARIHHALASADSRASASAKIAKYFWQRVSEIVSFIPIAPQPATRASVFTEPPEIHQRDDSWRRRGGIWAPLEALREGAYGPLWRPRGPAGGGIWCVCSEAPTYTACSARGRRVSGQPWWSVRVWQRQPERKQPERQRRCGRW